MEPKSKQIKSKELYKRIVTKDWEDNNFIQELVSDPIDTIEKLTGELINLPEGKTLNIDDKTNPLVIYLNIPAETDIEDMELNEEQLEKVAGGVTTPVCFGIAVYVVCEFLDGATSI
jgi:hypothetical protein